MKKRFSTLNFFTRRHFQNLFHIILAVLELVLKIIVLYFEVINRFRIFTNTAKPKK